MTFFVLAAYVGRRDLLSSETPETSVVGLALLLASVVVMPMLAHQERRVAESLGGDRPILADAAETKICVRLSISTLIGLGLSAVTGAAWLDPVAGFVIAIFAISRRPRGVGRRTSRGRRARLIHQCRSDVQRLRQPATPLKDPGPRLGAHRPAGSGAAFICPKDAEDQGYERSSAVCVSPPRCKGNLMGRAGREWAPARDLDPRGPVRETGPPSTRPTSAGCRSRASTAIHPVGYQRGAEALRDLACAAPPKGLGRSSGTPPARRPSRPRPGGVQERDPVA